jgi:hypothetical protein
MSAIPGIGGEAEDDFAAYEADAQQAPAESENILNKITRLTREAKQAAIEVNRALEELKTKQDAYRNLVEFLLPEAMSEAEQDKLKTSDGDQIELDETLYASIPKANLPQAIMWLTANHQSAIIKRKIELGFDAGENQKAAEVLDLILEAGFTPTDTQSVHAMSLAAALREMIKEGKEVPMALLGAYVRKTVKIKGVMVGKPSGS